MLHPQRSATVRIDVFRFVWRKKRDISYTDRLFYGLAKGQTLVDTSLLSMLKSFIKHGSLEADKTHVKAGSL